MSEPVKIKASIHRVVFTADDGFTVLTMKRIPGNRRFCAVGPFPNVDAGQVFELEGEWQTNRTYGRQFRVTAFQEVLPETPEGLIPFLAGRIDGIGPTLAERMVEALGVTILDVLDHHPKKLLTVPGIGRGKLKTIRHSWEKYRKQARNLMFLSSLGLGPKTALKIIAEYGAGTENAIRKNPYRLIQDVQGIGFLSADNIAAGLGIPVDSEFRIRAALTYELQQAQDEGHCAFPRARLLKMSARRLDLGEALIEPVLDSMAGETGDLVYRLYQQRYRLVFLGQMDYLERDLAGHVRRLMARKPRRLGVNVDQLCRLFEAKHGMVLDPVQIDAARALDRSNILIITGGPGTGKTTLVRLILDMLRHDSVKMAAPTGRAAQRMQETTGSSASTLHRLLQFEPKTGRFKFNAQHPLTAETVILDECSMLDLSLAAAVFRAIPSGCRLVMVGDVDQLPSVGPGRVLADLIDTGRIPVIRLQTIFRQSENSLIVANAHSIIHGRMPDIQSSKESGDFYFIRKDDPEDILRIVQDLPGRIARRFKLDPLRDIQVLSPMYRGLLGVANLNTILRETLNPSGRQFTMGHRVFRLGDKVMQVRNNYDLEVFNGDIGRVTGVDPAHCMVAVTFSDGKRVYAPEDLDQLVPAFACSIHKSQGSEYPAVIIPLHTQHYMMLRRNLLYTAVTRGKQMVVITGSVKALALAVKNQREERRYSLLKDRILSGGEPF